MRKYYIFNIKEEFIKLYKDEPDKLFNIFNRINNLRVIDKTYGYNLFTQICVFNNKKNINNFIKNKYQNKLIYSNSESEHIINNIFLNEISILKINYSNIKLETNNDSSDFLKALKDYSNNFFVCDFDNKDYYFLKKYKDKKDKTTC